jgi:hypothetical protein
MLPSGQNENSGGSPSAPVRGIVVKMVSKTENGTADERG